jgi:S-disulfanyl-L-cysteine oxidoreductase SoxD
VIRAARTHNPALSREASVTITRFPLAVTLLACAAALAPPTPAAWAGPAQAASRTVWDGVYTAEQAARGGTLFEKRCTLCHGSDLQGSDDPNGPPLRGRGFTYRWRNRTVGDLYTTILEDMPRSEPGSLTPDLAADLAAFVLSSNAMPAGGRELPVDAAALSEILMPERMPTR